MLRNHRNGYDGLHGIITATITTTTILTHMITSDWQILADPMINGRKHIECSEDLLIAITPRVTIKMERMVVETSSSRIINKTRGAQDG
jgi:hypothetical protein